MKTYSYKDLINAYMEYLTFKNFSYYERRYRALSSMFGIDLENGFNKRFANNWVLFDKSIKGCLNPITPFAIFSEFPRSLEDMADKYSNIFGRLQKEYLEAQSNLQYDLVVKEFGAESLFNNYYYETLLSFGFDDNETKPEIED